MRRFLLLLSVLFMPLALFAIQLVSADGLEADEALVDMVESSLNRKGDLIPQDVESLTLEAVWEDEVSIHLVIESYEVVVDRSDLQDSIDNVVDAFFTYPPYLDSSRAGTLQYIYGSSYSTYNLEDAHRGQIHDLVSPFTGERTARFIVSDVEDDGLVHLDPVIVHSASVGMELEKAGNWKLYASFGQVFMPQWNFSTSLRLKNTAFLYPFNPSVGVEYGQDDWGENYVMALLGVEYTVYLGGLVDSTFTLLEDGHLFAGVDLMLGYDRGFAWGSSCRFGYEHSIGRNFSWSLGAEYAIVRSEGLKSTVLSPCFRLVLGLGVMF